MTQNVADINELKDGSLLEKFIHQEIALHGGICFADYMNHCLYHPKWGYYMRQRQRIGAKGDFFTSSSVHKLFGHLIAVQLVQMWEILGKGAFTVVEQGAGEGDLALDILDTLAADFPDFYAQIRYVIVEISPDNCLRQGARLHAHREKVRWDTFSELNDIHGCFLSNELVDAFAVSILEKHDEHLYEVFVVERDGKLCEELRPVVSTQIADHFATIEAQPVEGNRAELCLAATTWIQDVAAKLTRGFVLTIDYGYPAQELYAPFRRQGTLLCYHHHQANDNPYQNIGRQDITSHVDFTALQKFGAQANLATVYFAQQYRFLLGLGFIEELMRLQAETENETQALALRMTLKNLIMPDGGMGETFKVLIQGKNVGTPNLLCARKLRDIPIEALAGIGA